MPGRPIRRAIALFPMPPSVFRIFLFRKRLKIAVCVLRTDDELRSWILAKNINKDVRLHGLRQQYGLHETAQNKNKCRQEDASSVRNMKRACKGDTNAR